MQPLADNRDALAGHEAPLPAADTAAQVPELGGTTGPDPTRFGDWERRGRCIDF